MKTLTFNTVAMALIGNHPKVRVRVLEGNVIQIRPTNRVTKTPLPAGEFLFDVKAGKLPSGTFGKVVIDQGPVTELLVNSTSGVAQSKRGWLELTDPGTEGELAGAVVKASN